MPAKGKTTGRSLPLFGVWRLASSVSGLVALLAFASMCSGENPGENPSAGGRRGIASNQSATLNGSDTLSDGEAPTDSDSNTKAKAGEASGAATPIKPVSPDSSEGSETVAVDESNGVAAQQTEPAGRRVPRNADSTTRAVSTLPDVPWYRTGIGALCIVLAVIATAVWCVRRWMPTLGSAGCTVLNVVGTVGLSPKHTVALVSMGRRFVLIGLSGDTMTRICEVSDPQEVAELTLRLGRSGTGSKEKGFESLLAGEKNEYAKVFEASNKRAGRAGANSDTASQEPIGVLLKRLRSLQMK